MSVSRQRFSLIKRYNGIYHILYYANGKRKWKSTGHTQKPEALKALTRLRELLQERTKSVSFEAFTIDFLSFSEAKNHARKTFDLYKAILRRFGAFVRDASMVEITPETIDKYKTKRIREVSPVSVNVELRMLEAAFSTAKRWKLVGSHPFDGVSLASVPEQAPLHLSHADFQRLLSCIKEGWLRDVVLFAVLTGMRRGEILNLHWCDVDLVRKAVRIQSNASWQSKHGKRRTIPLSQTANLLLQRKVGISASEYVFTLNDAKIYENWVTHLFKRYVREANLSNQRIRFHSLRHTFATWLAESNVSTWEIQKLMGHSDIKTTQAYSHIAAEGLHSTVNKISIEMN